MASPSRLLFKQAISDWRPLVFSILIFIMVVLMLMRVPMDPDMGWHIRNGADILRSGVPRGDLYSYTMFGYPWISHEWLTDVGIYLATIYANWWVISIFFAGTVAIAYWVAARVITAARMEVSLIAVLIAAMVSMPIVGVRVQMLTLLFLAVVLWLLFRWREKSQSTLIWWLVPLMLVWVNLHGGFIAGLVLITVFGASELSKYYWKKWRPKTMIKFILSAKQLWQLVIVGVISLVVTFINPYTWRVYEEIYRTLANQSVKQAISEWMPVTFNNSQSYNLIVYTLLLLVFLTIVGWRRLDMTKIILGTVFFVVAIDSWRNIPLFSLVTLPLLVETISLIAPKAIYYHLGKWWLILLALGAIGYLGGIRYQQILPFTQSMATWGSDYPYGATQYIKEHHLAGNLFNEYNWGGYLVWQLPEKKVFIDGRMAIWSTSNQNIFVEYHKISGQDDETSVILTKYDVGLALVYSNRSTKDYFLSRNDKWSLIYNDNLAMLFQRTDLLTI